MDPDEEFLDLVVIELRLDSLWVEMFLVLGLELFIVTLEATEDSRDLKMCVERIRENIDRVSQKIGSFTFMLKA